MPYLSALEVCHSKALNKYTFTFTFTSDGFIMIHSEYLLLLYSYSFIKKSYESDSISFTVVNSDRLASLSGK